MSAPTWPRLAGWLATREPPACSGRWRVQEDGEERTGTFAHRAGEWAVDDDADGRPPRHAVVGLLHREDWSPPDYTAAAGPPEEVEHRGRPAWRVELLPPPHKRGTLELVVDAALRLPVATGNAAHGYRVEVEDLVLGEPPDALFAATRQAARDQARWARLHQLVVDRPPPLPRWFPDRRVHVEADDTLTVSGLGPDGCVVRAPLGQQPEVTVWFREEPVVRLDAHGWSWAVARHGGLEPDVARAVVDAAVTGQPPR